MRLTKKIITVVVFAFVFISCMGSYNQQVEAKTEIEFWTMQLRPTYTDYINGLVEEYESLHPDIDINWVDVPWEDMIRKLVAFVSAGNAPDIVNVHVIHHAQFAEMGALANLDNYLSKNDFNEYFAGAMNATKFDGETVGIPWYLATEVTMYNEAIFKEADLDPANLPQNYEDLADVSRIIKEKTGKYGVLPPITESGRFVKYMVKDGIDILNENRTKAIFNTDKAIEFLDMWVQLYKDGVIPSETVTGGHRSAIEMFQSGQLAILATGPQFLNQIRENALDIYKNTEVAPEITTTKVGLDVQELVVLEQSKNKETAIDFIRFITNAENQLAFCKLATILPSIKEAAENPYFTAIGSNPTAEDKARQISVEQLSNAAVLFKPINNMTELNDIMDKEVEAALLGLKTAEEALNDAAAAWNELLQN